MTADREAVALFRELTGSAPFGMWSAPGRVNLIGEHTDYNEGFVLPFAIERRTYAAVGIRDDGRIRVVSSLDPRAPVEAALSDLPALFPDRRDEIAEWARYPLGIAWALLTSTSADAQAVSGVDIALASDVPVGAGLSSSAAIEGAIASALNDIWGLGLRRVALAHAGNVAENTAVGAPTGVMDQMASMLGERDAAIFLDCRSLDASVVELGLARAGLELVIVDTRVQHAHSTGGYGDRRAACERGAQLLGVPALRDLTIADLPRAQLLLDDVTYRRVRHVITEDARVQETVRTLQERGPRAIGPLLDASHASMRDDFEISVPELDLAVDTARAAGAVGARMTGGGFGGSALALVDHALVPTVSAAVEAAFLAAGFATPHVFTVRPSEGAHRDG
ncbi:galactokinase [Microbacterium sp. X-17]|uniref:galactokinase n=1 Tax=Microbacterium sp. X-17 TaxID=3144404 RepID=UPI0031F4CFB6